MFRLKLYYAFLRSVELEGLPSHQIRRPGGGRLLPSRKYVILISLGQLEIIDDAELKKIYLVLEYGDLGEIVWHKEGGR